MAFFPAPPKLRLYDAIQMFIIVIIIITIIIKSSTEFIVLHSVLHRLS